jgi:glycine hydroxymethyltransferase|tara:strand:- start:3418 stop:4734 length:1317 start_codon:yes stop_codon:yes gene_type:complete
MTELNKYLSEDYESFFDKDLSTADPELYNSIKLELERQQQHIELIASENIVSKSVLDAQGSIMTNKYAEGYPGRRYYGGCEYVDIAEDLALDRVKKLFECKYANVQPHSGAQANGAVYLALLNPGDPILGMSLNSGGHLTHGAKVALSGKWLNSFHYDVDKTTGLIDYQQVEKLAKLHKPKLIIAGGSAYSRIIDFKKFKEIANTVNAYLMVDMAHFAGLVAGKGHPNPIMYADVVTSTTHKVLRGGRGGIILTNREDIIKKINSAVFPGYQGGPLMHIIAAKAVAFQEALHPSFKNYIKSVLDNAKILSEILKNNGFKIFSGGTDTHLMLVDLRPFNVTGKDAETSLGKANITCNKNGIPFDTQKPTITSGIRLGTQAATTRGFGLNEFKKVGNLITKVIEGLSKNPNDNSKIESEVKKEVILLCSNFRIYNHLSKK